MIDRSISLAWGVKDVFVSVELLVQQGVEAAVYLRPEQGKRGELDLSLYWHVHPV